MKNNMIFDRSMEAVMHTLLPHSKDFQKAIASLFLVGALTAGSASAADTAAQAAVSTAPNEKEAAETARLSTEVKMNMQQVELTADDLYRIALAEYNKGNYELSIKYFLQVNELLRNGQDIETLPEKSRKTLDATKGMLGKAYYQQALELFYDAEKSADAGNYDKAVELSKKAIELYPMCKDIMEQMIAKYEKLKNAAEFRDGTSLEKADPERTDRRLTVETNIRKGDQFYRTKQWAKARDAYNEALAIDPYNEHATDALKRCYQQMIAVARQRQKIIEQERVAEVAWKGISPLVSSIDSTDTSIDQLAINKINETKNIEHKLKSIIIPDLEFEDQPLKEVIASLQKRSEELDPDPDKTGVNIVLLVRDGPAPAAEAAGTDEESEEASEDSEETEESEESGEEESAEGEEGETKEAASAAGGDHIIDYLKFSSVDFKQAIHLVCDAAHVRYRIEPHAVLIADNDVPLDEYDLKVFVVEKEALELIGSDEEGGGSGDASESVKQFFVDRGITFPPGTALKYDESVSRLIVKNTPEALNLIDEMVQEMNNTLDPQVLVQVKFVEIDMNDLEELGFEYTIARPNDGSSTIFTEEIAPGTTEQAKEGYTLVYRGSRSGAENDFNGAKITPTITSNAYETYTINAGDTVSIPAAGEDGKVNGTYYKAPLNATSIYGSAVTFGANSSLVRNAQNDPTLFGASGSVANDTVFSWSHSDSDGYDVSAKVHALDQADSSDILSAPRVTTMNMQPAVIKMVVERYYPDSWGEATLETVTVNNSNSSNGNNSIPVFQPSVPEFGDPVEEGIVLNVRPEVEELSMITLEMTPVIQEFVGWSDYSYDIPLGDNGELYPNTLKMPIIEARTVETTVVSFDNYTIVLGGIIRDRISIVEDQYPILGDLPLVGRLFQSKGRGSQKTNLLIFLTSRLVKPDGTPLRESTEADQGVPSFN